MVGDGHAMGVTTQILEHILGTAEGRFGVDDPVFSEQWPEPGSEDLGLREQSQIGGKVQLAMLKGRLESGDELAAKHTSEYLDGEEEVRTGSDPAGVIEGEPTGRDDTVDIGMILPGFWWCLGGSSVGAGTAQGDFPARAGSQPART